MSLVVVVREKYTPNDTLAAGALTVAIKKVLYSGVSAYPIKDPPPDEYKYEALSVSDEGERAVR